MKNPYTPSMTRHHPKVVLAFDRNLGRDQETLVTSEPLCGAPIRPGATSAIDAMVSCEKCKQLKEGK